MPFYQEDTGNGSRKTKDLFTREWIQGKQGNKKIFFFQAFFQGEKIFFLPGNRPGNRPGRRSFLSGKRLSCIPGIQRHLILFTMGFFGYSIPVAARLHKVGNTFHFIAWYNAIIRHCGCYWYQVLQYSGRNVSRETFSAGKTLQEKHFQAR